MASIRLILKFRRSDKSRLYISGDENQKIYQRDFNWNELDEGVHGYTITLQENKRNADAILRFAERLNGKKSTYAASCDNVHVSNKDDGALLGLINTLRAKTGHEQKTVVIGDMNKWEKLLKAYMSSVSLLEKALSLIMLLLITIASLAMMMQQKSDFAMFTSRVRAGVFIFAMKASLLRFLKSIIQISFQLKVTKAITEG